MTRFLRARGASLAVLAITSALVAPTLARTATKAAPDVQDNAVVHYAPASGWIVPVPLGTDKPTPDGAPYRVIYHDMQMRFEKDHSETFNAFRIRLLSPQALAIGSLSLAWNPASQDVTVNSVRIHRGDGQIDVLDTARFAVIQREANLEMAMLTGILTATMQVPGLQVGDEIEFQSTIRDRDILFGNHSSGGVLLALAEGPGANRIRLGWSADRAIRFQASPDLQSLTAKPDALSAVWEFRDPPKLVPIEGAPPRYNIRRLVEYSDFQNWRQVS